MRYQQLYPAGFSMGTGGIPSASAYGFSGGTGGYAGFSGGTGGYGGYSYQPYFMAPAGDPEACADPSHCECESCRASHPAGQATTSTAAWSILPVLAIGALVFGGIALMSRDVYDRR